MCLTLLEFQQLLWPCGRRSSSCITSPWFDPSLDRIQTSSKCKIKFAWNVSEHHATCRNASFIQSSPLRGMRVSSESVLNVDIKWKAQYFNRSEYWNPNLDLCPSGIWKIGTQWLIYWSLGLSMSEKPNITTGATDLGMNIYKINVPNSPTTPTAAVALW